MPDVKVAAGKVIVLPALTVAAELVLVLCDDEATVLLTVGLLLPPVVVMDKEFPIFEFADHVFASVSVAVIGVFFCVQLMTSAVFGVMLKLCPFPLGNMVLLPAVELEQVIDPV